MSSPSVSPPEPWVLLFIDTLIQRVSLPEDSRTHLLGLYQIGTSLSSASISQPHMMCWMLMLAHILSIESRSQHQATQLQEYETIIGELKSVVADIAIRLDNGFVLSQNQKVSIRRLAQHLVVSPVRTCYKDNLIKDIEKKMRAKPSTYSMDNIFGIQRPRREDIWTAEARKQCSAVRNALRKEIRDSVIGRKKCTVQQFTSQMLARYRLAVVGEGQHSEQTYLIHFAILRRFHWENSGQLRDIDESLPDNDDPFDVDEEGSSSSPSNSVTGKKRKALHTEGLTAGRVSDGNDYWAQVDAWFATRISTWGTDFASPQWREYIEESLLQDDTRFNRHLSTPLALTSVSQPITPTSGPLSNHQSSLVHTSSNPFLQASNTQGGSDSPLNGNWLSAILMSQTTNE